MRICSSATSKNLQSLAGIADSLGIEAKRVPVANATELEHAIDEAARHGEAIVLDVGSLKDLAEGRDELDRVTGKIRDQAVTLILYCSEASPRVDRFLREVTGGDVIQCQLEQGTVSVAFPETSAGTARELTSQSYLVQSKERLGLTITPGSGVSVIMKIGDVPAFVSVRAAASTIFVWSSLEIFDFLRPLAAEKEFEQAVDEYVPAIIFIRNFYGERCWHNPTRRASLVIDDPLLKRRYGHLDFPQLLSSARNLGYHVTLAFIPWNYWRSSPKAVREFIDHADCFSICAHGCDHIRNEFKSEDYDDLLSRNFLARQRMDLHEQRTGIPWEPLMVCPQEQYSLQGLRAFSDSRQFLGIVNTSCIPREGSYDRLVAADLLEPAQDSYFGFPIFKRHYWTDISVFAMMLFLGRPAILTEHHDFFQHGLPKLEDFVVRLRKVSPGIQWSSLIETAVMGHARRRRSEREWDLKFFTDTFYLEHTLASPATYRLQRRVPQNVLVRNITVDSRSVPFEKRDEHVVFNVNVEAPGTFVVRVDAEPVRPQKPLSLTFKYRASVAARRALSEFRDNVVSRNQFALTTARSLAKLLRQTAG